MRETFVIWNENITISPSSFSSMCRTNVLWS
jgi:hypothetical protein